MGLPRGRRPKPEGEEFFKNCGFSAKPSESLVIRQIAEARGYQTPFDYIRELVIRDDHPKARGRMLTPRMKAGADSQPGTSHLPPALRKVLRQLS